MRFEKAKKGNAVKKVYLFVAIALFECFAQASENVTTIHSIQRRYYLVRRLKEPMGIYFDIAGKLNLFQQKRVSSRPLRSLQGSLRHPTVKKRVAEMIRDNNGLSLHRLWYDFLSYKHVESLLFVRETITTILLIYRELLVSVLGEKKVEQEVLTSVDSLFDVMHMDNDEDTYEREALLAFEQMRRAISVHHHSEVNNLLVGHHALADFSDGERDDPVSSLGAIADLLSDSDSSAVAMDFVVNNNLRFYYIQRLIKAIFTLSKLRNFGAYDLSLSRYRTLSNIKDCFRHSDIKVCLSVMLETNDSRALFKLWKRFASYDYIDDELLLREFSQLVVIVYHSLAHDSLDNNQLKELDDLVVKRLGKGSVDNILGLYDRIAELPVSELLDLLDDVVDQLDVVVEKYELNNKEMSWPAWWKKYWWAPPVIVGTVGMTLVKHQETIFYFWGMMKDLLAKKAEESASASI